MYRGNPVSRYDDHVMGSWHLALDICYFDVWIIITGALVSLTIERSRTGGLCLEYRAKKLEVGV